MKKLLLILLSLIMCASVFASCNTETDNSSGVSTSSDNENSVGMTESEVEVSDNSSDNSSDDSSDVSNAPEMNGPEFDKAKVIYNPDEKHHEAPDVDNGIFEERSHIGLKEYISNTNDLEDAWFCVELNGRYTKNDTVFDIIPYLEKMGFVKDEALTLSFNPKGRDSTVVGYITTDMFEKLTEDNNPIRCAWLPKKCVDNGSHI